MPLQTLTALEVRDYISKKKTEAFDSELQMNSKHAISTKVYLNCVIGAKSNNLLNDTSK